MTRLSTPLLLALFMAVAIGAPRVAAQEPAVGGWTLRAVPDASPAALSDGPGVVRNFLVFCLSGEPFLAIVFKEARIDEEVRVDFSFASETAGGAARREPTAGGAYVIGLRDRPLAGLLAGRDTSAGVAIDGADQGRLSLSGSSKAIRGALETCQ